MVVSVGTPESSLSAWLFWVEFHPYGPLSSPASHPPSTLHYTTLFNETQMPQTGMKSLINGYRVWWNIFDEVEYIFDWLKNK